MRRDGQQEIDKPSTEKSGMQSARNEVLEKNGMTQGNGIDLAPRVGAANRGRLRVCGPRFIVRRRHQMKKNMMISKPVEGQAAAKI